MKKLSVIIVNYNVCYFLEQALASVRKAVQGIDAEVWVVDNVSHDGSVEMVREKFPEVKLIANTENVGFSRANNQAIRLSDAEYILLLNPDTVLEEDTLARCCHFMDYHPEAGGLGVRMLDGKGKFLPESKRGLPTPWVAFFKIFGFSAFFPKSKIFGRYHLSYLPQDRVHEIEVLSGAFMFMRQEALNKSGLLDEDFFMYGEDIDLSYRLIKAGYKNYYLPTTRIIHYKGESTKKGSLNYVFVFYQAMIIFANKHFLGHQAGLYNILIKLAVYLRATFAVVRRFFERAWPVLLDGFLIYLGMFFLKTYWENNHKYVPNFYPSAFMNLAVPTYILLWLGSVYLSGGYDKPVKPNRIIRGIIIGTILISAASNFAEAYRFSRALIILGGIWSIIALIGARLAIHFFRHKDLRMGEKAQKRVLLVGSAEEAARAASLLNAAAVDAHICGRVSVDSGFYEEAALGTLPELEKLLAVYEANEVIFCGRDVTNSLVIDWMDRLSGHSVSFRILPADSEYIIGSSSKDTQGDYYKREEAIAILQKQNLRAKRIFDLSMAFLLLVLSPLLVWKVQNRKGYFINCLYVLLGSQSWVGVEGLPKPLKPGVLHPADKFRQWPLDRATVHRIRDQYLQTYSAFTDLDILYKAFPLLGRQPGSAAASVS